MIEVLKQNRKKAILAAFVVAYYLLKRSLRRKFRLRGRTVLVTGGGSGIGKLLVHRLAQYDCKVVIWDIQEDMAKTTATEVNAAVGREAVCVHHVDLCKREQIYAAAEKTVQQVGFVDVVVNNAGIVTGKTISEASDAEILRTFDVNVLAHFWVIRSFLPEMIKRDDGLIVTIASSAGKVGCPKLVDYCSSKYAAVGLDESLRLELRRLGSRVQTLCLCPYYINTGMFDGVKQSTAFGLLKVLEPEYVVERLVQAMRHGDEVLQLPAFSYVGPFFRAIWSPHVSDWLFAKLGILTLMDEFTGRGS